MLSLLCDGCVRSSAHHAACPDPNYMQAFLLTYRSFATPAELIHLLIERYNLPIPPNSSKREVEDFYLLKRTPIRLRVFNVLKVAFAALLCAAAAERALLRICSTGYRSISTTSTMMRSCASPSVTLCAPSLRSTCTLPSPGARRMSA